MILTLAKQLVNRSWKACLPTRSCSLATRPISTFPVAWISETCAIEGETTHENLMRSLCIVNGSLFLCSQSCNRFVVLLSSCCLHAKVVILHVPLSALYLFECFFNSLSQHVKISTDELRSALASGLLTILPEDISRRFNECRISNIRINLCAFGQEGPRKRRRRAGHVSLRREPSANGICGTRRGYLQIAGGVMRPTRYTARYCPPGEHPNSYIDVSIPYFGPVGSERAPQSWELFETLIRSRLHVL